METGFYISTSNVEGSVRVSIEEISRFLEIVGKKGPQGGVFCEKTISLNEYINAYLRDIAVGRRVSGKGTKLSYSTVLCVRQALNKFLEYQKARGVQLDFPDIDLKIYRDYNSFLMGQNYSINTIGKFIKKLKQVLLCAEEDGFTVNKAVKGKGFKVHQVATDAIYLTAEDLKALNDLDLSGFPSDYALARDIFMIGVWTAQRVSDYNNLQPGNLIRETPDSSVSAIRITQKKTGKRVMIPCCSALQRILDKYPLNVSLPHLYEQKINNLMKEIGRLAGLDEPVEICSTKGGTVQRRCVPKWQLIQSHTARRTGATLMYLSGMDVYDICKITGHSSVQTLERYIKAGELETLKKMSAEYEFFR